MTPDQDLSRPPPGGDVLTLAAPVAAVAAPLKTRVVLDRDMSAFDRLSPIQRRRLIVRVLCGLVAYDDHQVTVDADRLAG